jgi:hypothetical protein
MSYANYDNPTALRLGAQGTLDGRPFTVKGRVVLGMELDGETYYWNEFNLVDQSGGELTLVHEETEDGYVWKLFRLYEPLHTLSVSEAMAKRAGQTVNFEGRPIHITLVDQSRVYHIEGVAPEGVEVGDVANYFNADAGDRTLVASWSGDEIEFYEGRDLPEGRVERAFNLSAESTASAPTSFTSTFGSGGSGGSGFDARTLVTIGGLLLTILAALFSCSQSNRQGQRTSMPPPPPIPVVRLADAMHGTLAGRNYTIAGQAQVEIAKQGGNFNRSEFDLVDEAGGHALLINGLMGNLHEWHLFQSTVTPEGFTPYDAAALRQGSPATIGGRTMQVTQLFQSWVQSTSGQPVAGVWSAAMQYGLLARANNEWLIVRWNETEIQLFSGKPVPESEVRAAFVPVEGKAK